LTFSGQPSFNHPNSTTTLPASRTNPTAKVPGFVALQIFTVYVYFIDIVIVKMFSLNTLSEISNALN
jgi:hypothetical protein